MVDVRRSRLRRRARFYRAAGVVTAITAVASLAAGVTFARLSAFSSSSSNTFTTGTVAVSPGTGTAVTCNVSNLAPGDASSGYPAGTGVAYQNSSYTECRYFVTYTGSVSAFLAVDVSVSSATPELYDSTPGGLQLLVKGSDGTTYIGSSAGHGGVKYTAQSAGAFGTTLSPGATASDLVLSTTAYTSTSFSTQFGAAGDEFTVDYNLPYSSSSNSNIGAGTTVTLTFHAVQAGNNSLPATCTSAGAGVSCTSGMQWS